MTSHQLPDIQSLESMGLSSSNIKGVSHQGDSLFVQFNSGNRRDAQRGGQH